MGNLPSSRRNSRISQNPPQPARMIPPPPGYPGDHVPFYYPPNYNAGVPASQFFHHNFIANNGPYVMTPPQLQPYSRPPQGPPPPPNPPRAIPEVAEQKANTIRNDVNLKKATLRLEQDEENPGYYLVAFTFDAMVAGSICIFYLSREGPDRRMEPLKPQIFSPVRISFEKGLGQKFRQAPGTGVMLALFDDKELVKGRDDIYPLVVRTETTPKKPPGDDEQARLSVPIGGPLPSSVHSQATHAVIERKDDDHYLVRVVKQIIWVDGLSYELQEIYGIENSQGGSSYDGNDSGKECVICMSEPRDTTVLPCRHMCMCSECAKVLRFQTSRCPICRTPVDRLLEIKVARNDPNEMRDAKMEGSSHQSKFSGGPSDSKHVKVEGNGHHSNLGEGASDPKES